MILQDVFGFIILAGLFAFGIVIRPFLVILYQRLFFHIRWFNVEVEMERKKRMEQERIKQVSKDAK